MRDHFNIDIPSRVRQLVTTDMAWKYRVVPVNEVEGLISFYTDKLEVELSNELEIILGREVHIAEVATEGFQKLLGKYYPREQTGSDEVGQAVNVNSDDFILQLIAEAKQLGSSDIHMEPYEEVSRVRVRVDGKLMERYTIPKREYPGMVNKVKIMGHLDIAEKRLPQDGRIFYNTGKFKFDIRVSVLPTLFGEKIVMRILSNDATDIDLEQLGFTEQDLKNYQEAVKRPNGIILISGPTGSGKTTTLYATLKMLNNKDRNIITIEDPVEYTLEGINQVQLREDIGMDFNKSLKTFLRQDPDIIMVGEIRDKDTAEMAVRTAMVGRLVLSTIHTNSAWGTIARLVEMGIPPYLVASTLNLSAAQRLVRLLCSDCKRSVPLKGHPFPRYYTPPEKLEQHYIAMGCDKCRFTGYRGRVAVYEIIPIDEDFEERIKNGAYDIKDLLMAKGIKLLSDQAFSLLSQGKTSIEEAYPLLFN